MIYLERVTMNKLISVCIIIISLIFMLIPSCISSNRLLRREQVILIHDIDLESVYRRLANAGFEPGIYRDDDFSQLSESIKRFQKAAKIEVDGILGKKTWDKIQILYDPLQHKSPTSGKETVLKPEIKQPVLKTPYKQNTIEKLTPEDNYQVNINDSVFAIEQFECSDISGDWVILYEGIITDNADDMLSIRLLKRYGYRYHPDKEGIDGTDWWCVPKKRHCYSEVKFTDWQGEYSENEIVSFPKERVYNANTSIVNGVSDFLENNCKR